jgi:hypothetical protein
MQACAKLRAPLGEALGGCCPTFVKFFAVLAANSATNHLFDSNLCNASIRRNDATDLSRSLNDSCWFYRASMQCHGWWQLQNEICCDAIVRRKHGDVG